MKIWSVDAFASKPYTGNPAAVTIVEEFPSDEVCQKIAAEINLSETAFVKPLGSNHFHIRWFTPAVEVKLCGHATLAATHILLQEDLVNNAPINFDSLSGILQTQKTAQGITLNFPLQATGPRLEHESFNDLFGNQIVTIEKAFDDVIVELNDEKNIYDFVPVIEKINQIDCRGLIITARGKNKYDFISRFFGPRVGVAEDPVTGSAHCKLAYYWQQRLKKNNFLAYQASKRGGELILEINDDRVLMTGSAITISCGNWLV